MCRCAGWRRRLLQLLEPSVDLDQLGRKSSVCRDAFQPLFELRVRDVSWTASNVPASLPGRAIHCKAAPTRYDIML